MKITFSKQFDKNYKKRIKSKKALEKRFQNRFALFIEDKNNPLLKLHKLKGNRNDFYAFSVTGDVRVILSLEDDTITFQDIGTHNQVYM